MPDQADKLRQLVNDALPCADALGPLTCGNPFDTLELVDSLRRDGVLRLERAGWSWDAQRIHQHLEGRNVEALVMQRLDGIPAASIALLDAMACVGGAVPLARLAVAGGVPQDRLATLLAPALHAGLLLMDSGQAAVHVRHDRVLQALILLVVATRTRVASPEEKPGGVE